MLNPNNDGLDFFRGLVNVAGLYILAASIIGLFIWIF